MSLEISTIASSRHEKIALKERFSKQEERILNLKRDIWKKNLIIKEYEKKHRRNKQVMQSLGVEINKQENIADIRRIEKQIDRY